MAKSSSLGFRQIVEGEQICDGGWDGIGTIANSIAFAKKKLVSLPLLLPRKFFYHFHQQVFRQKINT